MICLIERYVGLANLLKKITNPSKYLNNCYVLLNLRSFIDLSFVRNRKLLFTCNCFVLGCQYYLKLQSHFGTYKSVKDTTHGRNFTAFFKKHF